VNEICNWEYTGDYETDKNGYLKAWYWKPDCIVGTVKETRHNSMGQLLKTYRHQSVPAGSRFNVKCPYCYRELNLVNPYDDGETCRKEY